MTEYLDSSLPNITYILSHEPVLGKKSGLLLHSPSGIPSADALFTINTSQ